MILFMFYFYKIYVKIISFVLFLVDDETGNQRTLNRKLDRRLMLLFNLKFGNNYQWLLPQAKNEQNETLREVEKCI